MEEEKKIESADRELYLIQLENPKEGTKSWIPVDRSRFARHEGPSLSCLASSVKEEVATREGVSGSLIVGSHDWESEKRWRIQVSQNDDLQEALEYTQRTGDSVKCALGPRDIRGALKGHVVRYSGRGGQDVAIDGKWFVNTWKDTLAYDPEKAKGIEAERQKEAEYRAKNRVASKTMKIPARILKGMLSCTEDAISLWGPIKVGYASLQIQHNATKNYLARAIVKLAKWSREVPGRRSYRTWVWKLFVTEAAKHIGAKDTPAWFKEFVLKEVRATKSLRVRQPKWKVADYRSKTAPPCRHRWSKIGVSWGRVESHCTRSGCGASRWFRR